MCILQVRRDRSDFWEGIKAHNATVTCAVFAPHPEAIIKSEPEDDNISRTSVSNYERPGKGFWKKDVSKIVIKFNRY